MLEILFIVLPIFIVLGTGSFLLKIGMLNQDYIAASNRLVFNFFLPVLLFSKIAKSDFTQVFTPADILVMILAIVIIFFLSLLIGLIWRLPFRTIGTFTMNNFRGNYAYMGLPVCFYAFGDEGLAIASVLMAFIVPMVNMLSVISLSLSASNSFQPKIIVKNALYNPLVIACLTGIVFSLSKIPMPQFLEHTLSIISGITLPLALLAIGASINVSRLKGSLSVICTSAAMKLFILPLISFLIIRFLNMPLGLAEKVLIIMLASPAATVNFILASAMKGDTHLANGTIIATTLLSMISYVTWLHFLGLPD
ncbi:MAG: AEC family transporter [Bacillota bacterium]|nr:AEC family transporter [Clostridia bacterium]